MGSRHKSRELVLQALYALEMNPNEPLEAIEKLWEGPPASESHQPFARELLAGIRATRPELDRVLSECSEHWKLDRMSRVDLSILRMGIHEILFHDEIPAEVSINEAVELAKRFGSEDSAPFVNGILDGLARSRKKLGTPRPAKAGGRSIAS